MSLPNGKEAEQVAAALKAAEAAVRVNQDVIALLNDTLVQAKNGVIYSLALAAIGPDGQIYTFFTGPRRGDMHMACTMIEHQLLGLIMNPPKGAASQLVRASG